MTTNSPTSADRPSLRFGPDAHQPQIEGLRALAVLAVVVNHFSKPLLPGGYLGVDIFFVISGYVITLSLANRGPVGFADFFFNFYERRIKRLVPALVLCVVVSSVLICLVDPNPARSLGTGVAALFGVSNIYLLQQATDYFGQSTEVNMFTQTWSLGVEEQFYVVFPLLVWLSGLGRAGRGARKLFWVMLALSLPSLAAFVMVYAGNQPWAYFAMPTRFWELGAGCLTYLTLQKGAPQVSSAVARIGGVAIFLGMLATLFAPIKLGMQATVAIVLLTAALLAISGTRSPLTPLLTHPAALYFGRISYSLYLWHWTVLCISRWTIGIHWWTVPIQFGLMLLLAAASFRLLEMPLRKTVWSSVNWRSIGYGISASVTAALVSLLLQSANQRLLLTGAGELPIPPLTCPSRDPACHLIRTALSTGTSGC